MSNNADENGRPGPTTSEAFEEAENGVLSPSTSPTIGDVIIQRYSRRDLIKGSLGVWAASELSGILAPNVVAPAAATTPPRPSNHEAALAEFAELSAGIDERHHLAEGFEANVLLRWGDPITPGMPPFDPNRQDVEGQTKRFGYNNDYIAYFPLEGSAHRGLLCVNHEYTNAHLMFPLVPPRPDKTDFKTVTPDYFGIEMAAHGVSVVEVERGEKGWSVVVDSRFNRRITASTPMSVDGPAAGHDRMKTSLDPNGMTVLGTINNCAGGHTPWGTYLTAEENFNGYFWTDQKDLLGRRLVKGLGGAQGKSYDRYGVPGGWYGWGQVHSRFNVDKEPNEPNRFGWIVEIDPTDPTSTPVKHTALGRFRHEGAECIVNKDGRVVVYSGDDARGDYIYRFVSRFTFRDGDRRHNMTLLSDGALSVARFDADGTMTWLPLVHGQGPLTPANGFASQADVLIDARLAADALGATRMDRPEDVQPHPTSGKVWAMLTNNANRKDADAANPRAPNTFGHIIEMQAPAGDHAAEKFSWTILLRCGDPSVASVGALFHPETSSNGWFASPDNCAIDAAGRLWVATDQGGGWSKTGHADGLYSVATEGKSRGLSRLFFRGPIGAEICGPCFTPDGETLFLAVQHPGADGTEAYKPFGRISTFADPATRWPDFDPAMPPRPSVLAITRRKGGKI